MNLKRYSDKLPVYVSAGVLLAGTLWFVRMDWHIRGEDCAELISAVMERQAVAYLMGTNTPAFVSNVVPVWVEWKMMREKILDGALNVATNGGVRTDPPSRLPVVFWVGDDTSFADGATVCGNGAGWVITAEETNTYVGSGIVNIERNYSLSPVSNAWQAAVTPDARYGGTDRTWQFKKGVSTNNAPVADELYSCTNSFFKTKTNWWTNIGNGTNNYLYWSERYLDSGRVTVTLLSGGGWQQSRAVTTNYLNQAANVLSNLTRTVCFFNGADLDGTNCVRVEWSGVPQYTNESVWSWQSSPKAPIEFSSIVGDIWDATLLTETCQTYPISFNGELASASRLASEQFTASKEEAREDPDFWDEYSGFVGLGSAAYSSVRIINAFLPYPSDYALTNGLVKRVRVYAIVTSSTDGYDVGRWRTPYVPINSASFAASPGLESYTLAGSTEPLHKMLHEGLGIGADVGRYEFPAFNENGWTLALTPRYSIWSSAYTVPPVVIMRLLADVANPVGRVPITIGAPFKWPDYYVEVSHDAESGRYDKGDGYDVVWSTGHFKFRRQRVTVYLSMLAVVVDWDWNHLNPADPYEPPTYTPEWLSTNAP